MSPAPPTRVRYGVLAFLCSLCFVLYIDRLCITMAGDLIQDELGITKAKMGFVFSAFTIAYGLFEIPTGRWGDRFGSRGVLTRIVLWWSAFTVLTGCVWKFTLDSGYRVNVPFIADPVPLLFDGFLLLLIVRFLFGAGEAGALPNAARVIARWFPANDRGPAQGLMNTSMLVGGAITPFASAHLIEFAGWRWSFYLFGMLGVVWAAAFHRWFRDDPAAHPGVNEAERQLIDAGTLAVEHSAKHLPVPWRLVLTSPNVWLLGGIISCTAFTSYLFYTWYPTYLMEGRGELKKPAGLMTSLILVAGAVGATLGGYFGDWLVRRTGDPSGSRRTIGFVGLLLSATLLLASIFCSTTELTVMCTGSALFCAAATIPSWWAVVTGISGRHLGVLFGLLNSLGVPGAVGSQLFVGFYADGMKARGYSGRAQWDPMFWVYAGVLATGAVGWLAVNPKRSAVERSGSESI